MLSKSINIFKALCRRLQNPRLYYKLFKIANYTKKREILHFSPYRYRVLEKSISKLRNSKKININKFLESSVSQSNLVKTNNKKNNVYLRIDVDYQACVDNLSPLLNFLTSHQINAGVYIRTDCLEYDPSDCKKVIEKFKNKFEFGLHTSCYRKENYVYYFEKELNVFKKKLGFLPKSFSVHGYGSKYSQRRNDFYQYVRNNIGNLGSISFFDCGDILRPYQYVIQDCHLVEGRRFIYDDFLFPPDFLNNTNILILLHPCYWVDK